ncbi:MAG: flagellar basal body-associated FliL family protein [Proteobacteria bacterium]|nr:flagellar basal body-associated FliL family protein [Pseudomonadota bacterium]MBU1547001.1 flagellar basal body-associated FliL family protein [Pseudomonadota bacterium]MBU2620440.1 flagellar basal body-associated FliL family protein [Pseudomonadota bacterium]
MADERLPQSVDQFASTETPADHDETNWGEDWESAFQAEDDAFFSEEKEGEDFFLEENEPTATGGVGAKDLDSSLEKSLSATPDQSGAPDAEPKKILPGLDALPPLLLAAQKVAQAQFTRLQSFPIFVRIPLYALPFALVALFFVAGVMLRPSPPLLPSPSVPGQRSGTGMPITDGGAVGTPPQTGNQAGQLHPGKVRKKWPFPAFIIPVNNPDSDQPVTFVLVDITLIASFAEQEDPPADKKIFVRDIIYQFFQNKPLEDLRRYSLARGEMNKELRAWLQKQWPEAPIESIIFNQYHLS